MAHLESKTYSPVPSVLHMESEEFFSDIKKSIHDIILLTMLKHPYNTLNSFVNLHCQYRKQDQMKTLLELASSLPVSYDDGISCVGLSLKFMDYFSESRPKISSYLYLMTGDEYPANIPVPIHQNPPSSEAACKKGHVLVGLEFTLMGRRGYILIDIGVAVDIPVIVMRDGLPPHTGLFTQLSRIGTREYRMDMTDPEHDYVVWNIRELREDNREVFRRRFLYVGQSFQFPDELERRNWVYHYHGKVFLGQGGVRAGFYFTLGHDSRRFTVFVTESKGIISASFPYEYFFNCGSFDNPEVSREDLNILEAFAKECGLNGTRELAKALSPISNACCDDQFVEQVLKIHGDLEDFINNDML